LHRVAVRGRSYELDSPTRIVLESIVCRLNGHATRRRPE
jgi:hypothetical protein